MGEAFNYDVAFSFLSRDEASAQEINDALQDRYRTFLYSERQKELAGTDGEETFKKVFANEARIVAVLFRPEWGTTPWTRIEQTAIRDRAHDSGYDFCTFIALTDPIERPNWLPKNRLLYGLNRFGIPGAAAVLESRIQEQGGAVSEETVAQRGERLKRKRAFAEEAERFRLNGMPEGDAAVATMVQSLDRCASELTVNGLDVIFRKLPFETFAVTAPSAVLVLRWERRYSNSLSDSRLEIGFYDKFPRLPGTLPALEDAKVLERARFDFRLIGPSRPAWVHGEKEIIPGEMAEYLMKWLMKHSEAELQKKQF
jgi:hypothetical protein